MKEVQTAISELKRGKAPGPDGEMCSIGVLSYLTDIFNRILCNGIFPDSWSENILTPTHKKGDAYQPGTYRGIALSSHF